METTIKSNQVNLSSRNKAQVRTVQTSSSWDLFWHIAEFNRYGIATALLVGLSCISGFAAAFAVSNPHPLPLASVAAGATLVEALVLGVAAMKAIVRASILLLVIDLIVIGMGMLS